MSHAIRSASRRDNAGTGAGAGAGAGGGAKPSPPSREVDEALRAQIIQNAPAVDPAVEHSIRSWRVRRTANAQCIDSADSTPPNETHTTPPKETRTTPPLESEFLSEGISSFVAVEPTVRTVSLQKSLSLN